MFKLQQLLREGQQLALTKNRMTASHRKTSSKLVPCALLEDLEMIKKFGENEYSFFS